MRTPIIAGNWKMNTTLADAHLLADGVRNGIEHLDHVEVVLAPPALWITELAHAIAPGHMPHLHLAGQNMYFEASGAFTGETSPLMLREVAEYVILGHSERTHIFSEDAELIRKKVVAAMKYGLTPILCIGEDVQSEGSAAELTKQLSHLVSDLDDAQKEQIVVAYEPVWAIGSGNPATPEYAQTVMASLRTVLPAATRILYGGSVTDENAPAFLEKPDLDGFLIGGTSLKIKPFLTICELANNRSISSY